MMDAKEELIFQGKRAQLLTEGLSFYVKKLEEIAVYKDNPQLYADLAVLAMTDMCSSLMVTLAVTAKLVDPPFKFSYMQSLSISFMARVAANFANLTFIQFDQQTGEVINEKATQH